MKKYILIPCLLMLQALCGKQHFLLEFSGDYTWGAGNADFVKIKIIYHFDGKSNVYDSLILRGPAQKIFRRSFAQTPDSLSFQIVDHSKRIPQQNTFVRGSALQHCSRLIFPKLMKNEPCESFYYNELGLICASLKLSVFDDASPDLPEKTGLQQNDVYCETEAKKIRLNAPCHMAFRPAGGLLQWYESTTPQGPWTKIDTGLICNPFARLLSGKSPLFNQHRYYKLVSDSFTATGERNKSTGVFGPVSYYLNHRTDSIAVYGRNCSESQKRIDISLINDSAHQHASGINIWLKNLDNPAPSGTWFFGNRKNVTGIAIGETTGQYHPMAAQNAGKVFYLVNGMYAIGLDFTPWNDFDCGFRWDTVLVSGPYGIEINPRIICGESCPGNRDGKFTITGKSALWNDTVLISVKGMISYKLGDTIQGLSRGDYDYSVSGRGGCEATGKITIPGSPFFGKKFGVDTTLCLGQKLFIDAQDYNAGTFEATMPNGVKLLSDTFTAYENGQWLLQWTNDSGCVARDTLHILHRNLAVTHDFLMPAQVKLSDTAWAIDHSRPKPLSSSWIAEKAAWERAQNENLRFYVNDTGLYRVTLTSQFDSGCTFRRTKVLHIVGAYDTAAFLPQLGYQGPVIKQFTLKPNPSDGMKYVAEITLREPSDIVLILLDPVSGFELRRKEYKRIQYLSEHPFDIEAEGVYYLRVIAGNETRIRKILIIN